MPISEAQKRAKKKYYHANYKGIPCTVRIEFYEQFKEFMNSEQGKKYESQTKFVQQAIKEKMEAEGYKFRE